MNTSVRLCQLALFAWALGACSGSKGSTTHEGGGGAPPVGDPSGEVDPSLADDAADSDPASLDEPSAGLDDDGLEPDVSEGVDDEGSALPAVLPDDMLEPSAAPADGCEREVTFEAVPLSEPPPFDVVIVADHSGSIAWSRDELTAGLKHLLDDAKGHDVRVFVLTPTQYGASNPAPVDPISGEDLVLWRDPATGTPFGHAMTRYTQACRDAAGEMMPCPTYPAPLGAFTLEGWWNFQMPEPVAVIHKGMTAAERAEQQRALTDAVLALGTDGSPQEQPVCTLNRYVLQDDADLPEHVIFIVLSDEDDTSVPDDCLLGHTIERTEIQSTIYTRGCTSNCEAYSYSLKREANQRMLSFSCVPVDDQGNPALDQAVPGQLGLPAVDTCEAPSVACNTGDLAGARYGCPQGTVVMDCQKTCTASPGYYTSCIAALPGDADACTASFVQDGVEYANFADYCEQLQEVSGWFDCQREGLFAEVSVGYGGLSQHEPLMFSADTISMVREFQNTAKQKFGESGFVVETILFDRSFSCELGDGQSYGETLRELASTPEDVFPICESYAPALSRAERFAHALLQTEYALELGEYESIEAVMVTDDAGVERTLDASAFSHRDGQLLIQPDAITSADVSLTVQILNICVHSAR